MNNQKEIEVLRQEAADREQMAHESFERCDTDGFLSQWAHGFIAQEKRAHADLLENNGEHVFTGLYEGDRRVAAKVIQVKNKFSYKTESTWILRDDEASKFGRKFIPFDYSGKGKIQKSLGLTQKQEWAKAFVTTVSNGTGLAGAASARVVTLRQTEGDEWGLSSRLAE